MSPVVSSIAFPLRHRLSFQAFCPDRLAYGDIWIFELNFSILFYYFYILYIFQEYSEARGLEKILWRVRNGLGLLHARDCQARRATLSRGCEFESESGKSRNSGRTSRGPFAGKYATLVARIFFCEVFYFSESAQRRRTPRRFFTHRGPSRVLVC